MVIPTTGLVFTDDLTSVPNPVALQTHAILITDGQLYRFDGPTSADWTQITGGGGAVSQGPIITSGLTQATAKLLGRNTASTGAIEEITLGTNLSFSGTTLNASGGGGGGAGSQLDIAGISFAAGLCATTASDFTAGMVFRPIRASVKTTGIKFHWAGGGGALTCKATLRTSGDTTGSTSFGTVVEAITGISVNANGVYTANFASELTLTQNQFYAVVVYENSGTRTIGTAAPGTFLLPIFSLFDSAGINYVRRCFVAGDANPTSNDQTVFIPIQIVVSG